MTEDDIRREIREKAVDGFTAWAARNGVSRQYVTDVLAGRRAPGRSILAAMGIERVVTYRRVG